MYYDEMFAQFKTWAETFLPPSFSKIEQGALPQDSSLTMTLAPGGFHTTDMCGHRAGYFNIVFNGKHVDAGILVGAMSQIHRETSAKKNKDNLPTNSPLWEIYKVESVSNPAYLNTEESTKQQMFGSTIQVYFNSD